MVFACLFVDFGFFCRRNGSFFNLRFGWLEEIVEPLAELVGEGVGFEGLGWLVIDNHGEFVPVFEDEQLCIATDALPSGDGFCAVAEEFADEPIAASDNVLLHRSPLIFGVDVDFESGRGKDLNGISFNCFGDFAIKVLCDFVFRVKTPA